MARLYTYEFINDRPNFNDLPYDYGTQVDIETKLEVYYILDHRRTLKGYLSRLFGVIRLYPF